MSAPRILITAHWFREGPGREGYWICAFNGCGRHRADHVQAEGQWRKPLHAFVPQRINPSRCKPCGRHRLHTTHTPWTWDRFTGPNPSPSRPTCIDGPRCNDRN